MKTWRKWIFSDPFCQTGHCRRNKAGAPVLIFVGPDWNLLKIKLRLFARTLWVCNTFFIALQLRHFLATDQKISRTAFCATKWLNDRLTVVVIQNTCQIVVSSEKTSPWFCPKLARTPFVPGVFSTVQRL